jgi:hypothetical protein
MIKLGKVSVETRGVKDFPLAEGSGEDQVNLMT